MKPVIATECKLFTILFRDASRPKRRAIETIAQKISDVRKNYPDAPLTDFYDELSMPKDLRDVHRRNDLAVAKVCDFEKFIDDEPSIVIELLKLYKRHASAARN